MHISTISSVKKREDIMPFAQDFAAENVDRSENPDGEYHSTMTIHDNLTFDSFEEAEEAIKKLDNGWYDDHAVKYHPTKPYKPNKKIETLNERLKKTLAQAEKYYEDHRIQTQKAKLITCPKCGSKIAKDYLGSAQQWCPVCRKDLRSDYILEKLDDYDVKAAAIKKQIEEERKRLSVKNVDRSKTYWAVKVEVHC